MITIVVTDKGGPSRTLQLDKTEVSIGRIQDNDVVLPKGNVSKRHARIVLGGGRLVVEDAKSTNGTYVNGKRIDAPCDLRRSDRVFIGDFTLEVRAELPAPAPAVEPEEALPEGAWRAGDEAAAPVGDDWAMAEPGEAGGSAVAAAPVELGVPAKAKGRATPCPPGSARAVDGPIAAAKSSLVELAADNQREPLVAPDAALEIGPLEELLRDERVTDIVVNGASNVYAGRDGRLERVDCSFSSDQAVLEVIRRILAPLGQRLDERTPMLDARLDDGSRVNAVLPPLAANGPCLTIRKLARRPLSAADLVTSGTLSRGLASFLERCVEARQNIVVAGGAGSGKTTILQAVASFVPAHERIITIEDAAELQLEQEHVVTLLARAAGVDGEGAITVRDLVRNALRMRPDRIVVGECRGGEALELLQAMSSGHEGVLTTVHANDPRGALARLEAMALTGSAELPVRASRDQAAHAVDIVVQLARSPDGSRRVTHVCEVTGLEGDALGMRDLFVFERRGFDEAGKVAGSLRPTGVVPRFYEALAALGLELDRSIFDEA